MNTIADRGRAKWDKGGALPAHRDAPQRSPRGLSAQELADRIGVSKRTVYRDLLAMDSDAGLPIWQDKGKFGLEGGAFLPPLALTLHEATTLFLAARLLAKASDEHDTELIGGVRQARPGPAAGARRAHRGDASTRSAAYPPNARFTRVFRVLAEALGASGASSRSTYDAGVYDATKATRKPRVQPLAIEPSALDPRAVPASAGTRPQGAAHVQGGAHPVRRR